MKRIGRSTSVLALVACLPAWAMADGRRGDLHAEPPMARAMGQSLMVAPREAADPTMKGRMSPEERRRLKADVSDAGRSNHPVYPGPGTGLIEPPRRVKHGD